VDEKKGQKAVDSQHKTSLSATNTEIKLHKTLLLQCLLHSALICLREVITPSFQNLNDYIDSTLGSHNFCLLLEYFTSVSSLWITQRLSNNIPAFRLEVYYWKYLKSESQAENQVRNYTNRSNKCKRRGDRNVEGQKHSQKSLKTVKHAIHNTWRRHTTVRTVKITVYKLLVWFQLTNTVINYNLRFWPYIIFQQCGNDNKLCKW